ncbi:MAG: 2Fe-2S iron-sulfur cluster-binding protein [Maritimibacter harenae]
MAYNVEIADTDFTFDVEAGETVLDAAERQGLALPYSCRKGVCNTCMGRIVEGHAGLRGKGDVSGPADNVMFCQARPQSDLTIAPASVEKVDPVRRKTVSARIRRKRQIAPDVVQLSLRFPIGTRVPFEAGQYLRVTFGDGQTRNYSMANPPRKNDGCELHVRVIPGGRFSDHALRDIGPGDHLEVELPFGTFGVDRDGDRPAILLAGGTGYAPIRSVIAAQIDTHTTRPLHLFWGARSGAGLYELAWLEDLAATAPWFTFTPVVSDDDAAWTGKRGLVHQAVLDHYGDLSGHEVYACGAPGMIDAARDAFVGTAGLPTDRFHADAFLPTEGPSATPNAESEELEPRT